jgi:energy-converting hydrogenase B subunit D
MIPILEISLYVLLILAAIIALETRDLLASIVALGVFSFFTALLLAVMGAVDVAFTEVVLGAGVTGVLFVAGIAAMSRRSVD